MQLSHRIELKPTPEQAEYFARACGTARFVWNWGLGEWMRQYAAGGKPNAMALKKQFNAVKYAQWPWMKDVHRDAHAQPFRHLSRAWTRFFADVKANKPAHAPEFKKKGKCVDSFYVANDKLSLTDRSVRLPLVGHMPMTEALRWSGKILGATVSRTAQRWYLSVQVEVPDSVYALKRTGDGVVGMDLGIKTAIVLSNGQRFDAPKPLKTRLRRLRIRSRQLSRKVEAAKAAVKLQHGAKPKGHVRLPVSKNRIQCAQALARHHADIASLRANWIHQVTNQICRENQTVVIENLNVKGMVKNEKLARAISDVGFGGIRRALEYKALRYGTTLILADRWYPSSKLCSVCDWKYEALTLKERTWTCRQCGTHHDRDRDLNAAANLERLATSSALPVASQSVTADTGVEIVSTPVGKVTPVSHESAQSGVSGQEMICVHLSTHF